jgi:hypothetical protein
MRTNNNTIFTWYIWLLVCLAVLLNLLCASVFALASPIVPSFSYSGQYTFSLLEENAAWESQFIIMDNEGNAEVIFDYQDEPFSSKTLDLSADKSYSFFYKVRETGDVFTVSDKVGKNAYLLDGLFFLDDGGNKHDKDYNDMTIQISQTPVVSNWYLFASGLCVFVLFALFSSRREEN